jgi:RIO kinase 1
LQVAKGPKSQALTQKFAARIRVGDSDEAGARSAHVSHSVRNEMRTTEDKQDRARARDREKADRATVDLVLDPRTRLILFKMLNSGLIQEINGCISTGKEAHVYHAVGKDGEDLAIKIYNTSVLVFKDRDRYVTGEHRFRHGYCKSNPRKMVKLWAEKEMRNLKRLDSAGIPCPRTMLLRNHVLLMTFIGTDGWYCFVAELSFDQVDRISLICDCSLVQAGSSSEGRQRVCFQDARLLLSVRSSHAHYVQCLQARAR